MKTIIKLIYENYDSFTSSKKLIADLSKVELINSSGLGMLVAALRALKSSKIDFILISVPQKVKQLLEITHLNSVFTCFEDLATALKSE